MRTTLALTSLLLFCTTLPAAPKLSPEQQKIWDAPITIQGRAEHPTVYLTRADLQRARDNRAKFDWAKKAADELLKKADVWANKSDEEIASLIPNEGACFAYGFSSCPLCDKQNSWWGATGCTLDDPGHVRCPSGHRMPDAEHPDPGTGWVAPSGKIHYFVGTYNAFLSEQLLQAGNNLAHAFALTGDAKYGHKAALLLDHLARVYPTCDKGSWDYPSNPPSGRFNRPWYQVARTLIQYTNQYDILMNSEHLNEPSSVQGLTRRQNIERNLILNGARYCYEQSILHPSLNNGQCDYIRGCLVAGVAMGIPEYVKWGVDGPTSIRAMIENNIDRDGQYYETSTGYSHHSRYLYLNCAEILNNYKDSNYSDGIHLADHPKLRAFALFPQSRTQVVGLQPHLGDDTPNTRPGSFPTPNPEDLAYLDQLLALSTDPAQKQQLAQLLLSSTPDLNATRSTSKDPTYLLFHAEDLSQLGTRNSELGTSLNHPLTNAPLTSSDLLTFRNFSILRSPTGAAVTLRSGPTLNHGQYDEMNLNVFAFSEDLTYDIGYGLASTHTQVGFAKLTAAHNTVLVDETTQLRSPLSGGHTTQFVSLPGFSLTSASNPHAYVSQKVTTYARTTALIDIDDSAAYAIDLFRVEGGQKHDYVFHGRGTDTTASLPLSEPAKGSLAGPDIDYLPNIASDGDLRDVPNKPYYNPPPHNGLGFLHAPRTAQAGTPFSLTWHVASDKHLKVTLLPTPDTTYVTATGPGILPGKYPQSTYLYARRPGTSSTFASVIEPHRGSSLVKDVTPLLPVTDAGSPVAIKTTLATGRTDIFLHAPAAPLSTSDGNAKIEMSAGTALVSVAPDGGATVTLSACPSLSVGEVRIQLPNQFSDRVTRVDYDRNILFTALALPEGAALAGSLISINNPAYSRPTNYRIASVSREGSDYAIHLSPTSLILARPHVEVAAPDDRTLANVVPLEFAKAVSKKYTGVFNGKLIATADGQTSATIQSVNGTQGTTITLADSVAKRFPSPATLVIYDIRPGDTFSISTHARVQLTAQGKITAQSTAPVTVTFGDRTFNLPASAKPRPAN